MNNNSRSATFAKSRGAKTEVEVGKYSTFLHIRDAKCRMSIQFLAVSEVDDMIAQLYSIRGAMKDEQ